MPSNNFGGLTILPVEKSNTISEMIDIVNINFEKILLNGGGPRGLQGTQGLEGVPGQTIIGPIGPAGPTGTTLHFAEFTITNGQPVVDGDHIDGDVIIDDNGIYYEAELINGQLVYTYRINLASISLDNYLVNRNDINTQGNGTINNHHFDSGSNGTNTLFIAERSPGTGGDDVEYRRLCIGGIPALLADNASLTLVNMIPETSTNAADGPFSQLMLKYRDSKDSGIGISSLKISHREAADELISSIESGNVYIRLITDINDPDNNNILIKSPKIILNGDSDSNAPDNRVTIAVDTNGSTVESDKIIGMESPVQINKKIGQLATDVELDNSTTFSIPHELNASPILGVNVVIPSNRDVGRIDSIVGGSVGQTMTILNRNDHPKGIVITSDGNMSPNRDIINLRKGDTATFRMDTDGNWYELNAKDDYQITYISGDDISNDYDNLIDDGIYMVYREGGTDYLNDYFNSTGSEINDGTLGGGTASDGGGGSTGNTDELANASPDSVDGYGVITYNNKTYNNIVYQKQVNITNNLVWERMRYIDGAWSPWKSVLKLDINQGEWIAQSASNTGYTGFVPDSGTLSHRLAYMVFNKTCTVKFHAEGTATEDNPDYIRLSLVADININVSIGLFLKSPCTFVKNEDSNPEILPAYIRCYPGHFRVYYTGEILNGESIRMTGDFNIPIN